MSETEFLIGRDGLDLQDDFYPDDLPNEWRFDYYSTMFKALSLPIDTEEDLDQIFEELEQAEDDEEFELVLSVKESELEDVGSILSALSDHKSEFTLFCHISSAPSKKAMSVLANYQFCLQSSTKLSLNVSEKKAIDQYLYFNKIPVFYSADAWDEKQIRQYLEQISDIKTKTILICKYAESETLNKIRIIAEMLGF